MGSNRFRCSRCGPDKPCYLETGPYGDYPHYCPIDGDDCCNWQRFTNAPEEDCE